MNATHPDRLSDWPLWRLIVALEDAERQLGPDSETTRIFAEAVRDRLKSEQPRSQGRRVADAR